MAKTAGEDRNDAAAERYGWGGWKVPILNWADPDYCEHGCPVCRAARRGSRLAQMLQRIELIATFGGCLWGRARRRKYGVPPDQPLPGSSTGDEDVLESGDAASG